MGTIIKRYRKHRGAGRGQSSKSRKWRTDGRHGHARTLHFPQTYNKLKRTLFDKDDDHVRTKRAQKNYKDSLALQKKIIDTENSRRKFVQGRFGSKKGPVSKKGGTRARRRKRTRKNGK